MFVRCGCGWPVTALHNHASLCPILTKISVESPRITFLVVIGMGFLFNPPLQTIWPNEYSIGLKWGGNANQASSATPARMSLAAPARMSLSPRMTSPTRYRGCRGITLCLCLNQ